MTGIDYIGAAAAIGLYSYCLIWLCRAISDLTRPDED